MQVTPVGQLDLDHAGEPVWYMYVFSLSVKPPEGQGNWSMYPQLGCQSVSHWLRIVSREEAVHSQHVCSALGRTTRESS